MQVAAFPKSYSEKLYRNGKKFSKAQEEVRSKLFYDVNFKVLTAYDSPVYPAPSGLLLQKSMWGLGQNPKIPW
jgi:hypothetical protein